MDMNDILNPQPAEAGSEMVEPPQVDEPQGEPAGDGGAPTAPQKVDTHVPLAALEAERSKRNDYKDAAARAEERARMLEERLARFEQPQQATQQPEVSLLEIVQKQNFDERCNTSRLLLLAETKNEAELHEKLQVFRQMVAEDPSIEAAMRRNPHPWKFVYDKVNQHEMLREIGGDPMAYRQRIEAEIMERLQKEQTPAPLKVPASLNGVRSVAPRGAQAYTGPTPLSAILNR